MKTAEILRLLIYFIRLSFRILIPIAIIFFIGYYLVYKKILKGTRKINGTLFKIILPNILPSCRIILPLHSESHYTILLPANKN